MSSTVDAPTGSSMSISYDVLVAGAGPAGVSAAIEAARRGARVLVVEQRPHAGGAIHRAAHDGGPSAVPMPARHKKNWARLQRELEGLAGRIRLLTSAVFLGIDGQGVCMIDSRADNQVKLVRPRAVIFATGATERVPHIPGWQLPGVVTAGGLQVQMKESGQAPRGRILVAGNGPLPLALAAQLAALGNAPVAVLEAADPYRNVWSRPLAALGLAAGPRQLLEAMAYFRALRAARVPYRTATTVSAVTRYDAVSKDDAAGQDDAASRNEAVSQGDAVNRDNAASMGDASQADAGLLVRTRDRRGQEREYRVDLLVLHGGLACNDRGIPADDMHGIVIAKAGDCNQVLGADAALSEGRRIAAMVMAKLAGGNAPRQDSQWHGPNATDRHPVGAPWAAAFQKSVWRLFEHAPMPTDADTVVCRCEGVTRRALADQDLHSAREIRLVGRIGMGLCQGRFCAHAASTAASSDDGELTLADIDGA
ncbi:MAG TPA: FAD-dependent oxidoreductase, partial [Bordetella sp.]|nr:FAD-dependent oxidoreductase [Bordetella sp.]